MKKNKVTQTPTRRRNDNGNNPPRTGGGKRHNRDTRKQQRREEAAARQKTHNARSLKEKAQRASRYGECKEFVRLHRLLKKEERK